MEIYNEKIYDLLTGMRQPLEVHQAADGSMYVGNLKEEVVMNPEDIESILMRGESNRSVASTAMNTDSSRSHSLLQIVVTAYNTISKVTSVGKLTLVDLAGSERVSKSEASGQRLVEAAAINKSLSALGQVCMYVYIYICINLYMYYQVLYIYILAIVVQTVLLFVFVLSV